MKIGIIGASGKAGSCILEEALVRSHDVTAIVRDAGKLAGKTVPVIEKEIFDVKHVIATANSQAMNLDILRQTKGIRWTFLSPSAHFVWGTTTGFYQTGKDHLLTNLKGDSHISYQDYAIAVLDEIENPRHLNERFTVVSESE